MQGPGTVESLDQQHKASRGRFSIGDGHGFESILHGAMEVECKPSSKHPADEIKNKDDLLTLEPFVDTLALSPTGTAALAHSEHI